MISQAVAHGFPTLRLDPASQKLLNQQGRNWSSDSLVRDALSYQGLGSGEALVSINQGSCAADPRIRESWGIPNCGRGEIVQGRTG